MVQQKTEEEGASRVTLPNPSSNSQGGALGAGHTYLCVGLPQNLQQTAPQVCWQCKLLAQHLHQLCPAHPVISLLEVNEGER